MTEEIRVFKLSDEDLANKRYRRGYPGRLHIVCHKSWDKNEVVPHEKFNEELASYYKAGQYIGLRGHLMDALNAKLPPRKTIKHDKSAD